MRLIKLVLLNYHTATIVIFVLQFYQEFRLFFCLSLTVFLNAASILSEGNLLVYGLTSEETFSKTMQGWLKT